MILCGKQNEVRIYGLCTYFSSGGFKIPISPAAIAIPEYESTQ